MPTHRAWILVSMLFCATALSFLDRQLLSVLAPELMREFGMSNAAYSRIVFAFVLSYTVMFALGGRLTDALGTRLGLGLSVGLWSVASMAKELTQKSLPEIGELFGGRDHTTVLHAVRKITAERAQLTELNQQLHVLEQTLKG